MKGLLFTYGLTYGGAVVSLFNPFYGLLVYICFAIIKPPALWHWSVPIGNYSRVIGVAFLIGWAINGFGSCSLGKARPIALALLAYYLCVILSTLFSAQPELGFPFIEYMAKIVLPFIAGITLVRTWRQVELLTWTIVGSCAFLAYELNLAYLQGVDVEHQPFIGLDNNSVSILIATAFGLALMMAFEEQAVWRKLLCFGIAAAMAHVPMLLYSRGGMLGTFAAAGVAVAIVPKSGRTWLLIAAAIVVGAILAGPSVVDEFSTIFSEAEQRDFSAQSRLTLWAHCVDAALKNPLFGVGQEHWGLVVTSYGWPRGKEAHSLWFQTAAELGITGITSLLAFYYLVISRTWRAWRLTGDPRMSTIARMMTASLAGFGVSASFVTVEGFELPYYVALIGACRLNVAYLNATKPFESGYAPDAVGFSRVLWPGTVRQQV
jgi:O-antigen ligase